MRLKGLILCTVLFFGTLPSGRISAMGGGNLDLIVGFRGGVSFSLPLVMNRNEVIQGYDPANLYEKDYAPLFSNIGYHYAFMFMAYLNESLSLSVEPAVATYSYKYRLTTGWTNGADPNEFFEYSASHRNNVSYLELPVVLRYEYSKKKIHPFVSLGIVYGYRTNAYKKVDSSVTLHTGTASIPYENSTTNSSNSESYIHSRFGIAPGIGLFYPVGTVKIMLSADFCFGLNNITNESRRYDNSNITSGLYDVQDDITLNALNITLGILFNTRSNNQGNSSGKRQGGKAVDCPTFKQKRK